MSVQNVEGKNTIFQRLGFIFLSFLNLQNLVTDDSQLLPAQGVFTPSCIRFL